MRIGSPKTLDAVGKVMQPLPMKNKSLIAAGTAAVLAVLAVLAAIFYLKGTLGPSDAAAFAPDGTVLFINLPNLPRTAARWQGTALAKIAAEPGMKAFLEKPLARILSHSGGSEAGGILCALKPTNLFVAVANISPVHADVIVGFQYGGGHQAFDDAVARMRRELPASGPVPAAGQIHNEGNILTTQHGTHTICSATRGRWGFVSTDADQIRGALDRLSGAKPGLSANPRFRAVKSHMMADPDFLLFLETGKALDALLAVGKSMGAEAIPSQIECLRATEAVGAAFMFDGELQRDVIFALRPGAGRDAKLARKPLRFTTADTAFFGDFAAGFDGLAALVTSAKCAGSGNAEISALAGLADAAFGPECGLVGSWPAGQMAPAPLLAVEVRDPAKASEFVQKVLALFPEAIRVEDEGVQIYSLPSMSNPLASPTFAQTDGFLLLGLDASTVASAAKESGATPTLEASPAFSAAAPAYSRAGELFAFVDTRTIFERAYTALRPVIIFGAAVMPGATDWIDPAKLPQTDEVARHLVPIVLSEQRLNDGILIESSGPFTLNQVAFAVSAAAILSRGPSLLR